MLSLIHQSALGSRLSAVMISHPQLMAYSVIQVNTSKSRMSFPFSVCFPRKVGARMHGFDVLVVKSTLGPRRTKKKRDGRRTSAKSPRTTALDSRTKAETGLSRKSTSPTRTLFTSAPGGIFFMNGELPFKFDID